MNDRAIVYRRKYGIPQEWGTAVNVQAMVYGNTGEQSGSGVAFTRDPATGEKVFYGEFLINAQGEDVVAGGRAAEPVRDLKKPLPQAFASGLPGGPGAASGKIYFNADRAAAAAAKGEKVLLVRNETSPEDLRGMIAAEGILTAKGGVSSHAALVARQMGKVCVCGASGLNIDYKTKELQVSDLTLSEGDFLSVDGTSGSVYAGEIPTAPSEIIQGLISGNQSARKSPG